MGTVADMYGVNDDEDGTEGAPPAQPLAELSSRMNGLFSEISIGGNRVSVPNVEYVRLLEARLGEAERTIRRMGVELRELQQSNRRRVAELDGMRRRIDAKPGMP